MQGKDEKKMSKFKSYADRVNTIAKAAFAAYLDAKAKEERAEARYREETDPYKGGSYEQQARAARAKADLLDAQKEVKEAQKFMQSEIDNVRAVGRELQAAVAAEYCPDGSQVDMATVELMRSGILKPHEYFSLYEKAQNAGNHTMCRLIGKYIGDAAPNAPTNELQAQMTQIANNAQHTAGQEYTDRFNALLDAYSRTANNPAMMDRWDEITAQNIETF